MRVFRYETPIAEVLKSEVGEPKIFLAGPTVRGNQPHLTSWRFEAIEIFDRLDYQGDLIVPEFLSKTESDQHKDWIPAWEYDGLKAATVIMFWIPRTRDLIGLTTNFELGYWMARDRSKVVYGRPDDAYRIRYSDNMWDLTLAEVNPSLAGAGIFNTLEDTVTASINLSKKFIIF